MPSSQRSNIPSRIIALLGAALLAFGWMVTTPLGQQSSAQASERTEVECFTENSLICEESMLRNLIANAGATPTRIVLGLVNDGLTQTLIIPSGSDIELVNYPQTKGDLLYREDGFTGVMVSVEEGATLTLGSNSGGGDVEFGGRGQWIPDATTHLFDVQGTLIMDAGSITGARNMSTSHTGAVTVHGANAQFIMNGGSITDNQRRLGSPGTTQRGAAQVAVTDGAKMVLNGGSITDGRADQSPGAYGETGGVGLYNGGTLEMNGGEISDNIGWGGNGVLLWSWPWSLDEARADKDAKRNHFTLNNGSIANNHSSFSGGGVFIWGNSEATMTGGKVVGNTSPYGAGVATFDDYVSGGPNFSENASTGKNSGLSPDEWAELSPAAFTMTGGEITGNHATRTGGGVNVVSNRVLLTGGKITDNKADHQGGGVYVATKSYTVRLESVMVTGNTATYIGGGLWVCPTGSVETHVNEGGGIFANAAESYGDDIAHDNYGSAGAYELYLAERMLGLGNVSYYWDNAQPRFAPDNPGEAQIFKGRALVNSGLKAYASGTDETSLAAWDAAQEGVRQKHELLIQGNTAYRGAGIGSNGAVVIGTDDVDVPAKKTWVDEAGAPLTDNLPGQIELQLTAKFLDDGTTVPVGMPVKVSPDENGQWQTTFTDLPVTIDGRPVEYSVTEKELDDFTASVRPVNPVDATADGFAIRIENTFVPPTPTPTPTPPETPSETPVPPGTETPMPAPTGTTHPSRTELSATGADGSPWIWVAAVSIALGFGLTLTRRRAN